MSSPIRESEFAVEVKVGLIATPIAFPPEAVNVGPNVLNPVITCGVVLVAMTVVSTAIVPERLMVPPVAPYPAVMLVTEPLVTGWVLNCPAELARTILVPVPASPDAVIVFTAKPPVIVNAARFPTLVNLADKTELEWEGAASSDLERSVRRCQTLLCAPLNHDHKPNTNVVHCGER